MPITTGPNGVVTQTTEDIVVEYNTAFQDPVTGFGPDFVIDPMEVAGIMIGIIADREASLQAAILGAQNGFRKNSAIGDDLDNLADLLGVSRRPATASTVSLRLTGTANTNLGNNRRVQHSPTQIEWSIPDGTVIGAGGTVDVTGTATVTGPNLAQTSNTNWQIVTQVQGWTAVESLADAVPGRTQDSNAVVRTRMTQQIATAGRATVPAIRANMLQEIEDLVTVQVFDRPGEVEIVVEGGTDQEVAEAIFRNVSAGTIQLLVGTTTVTITDELGQDRTIRFTRVSAQNIWINVAINRDGAEVEIGANAAAAVEAAILAYGLTLRGGDNVIPAEITAIVMANIPDFSASTVVVTVSVDGTTFITGAIQIGATSKASFDSARTDVTITP